MKKLYFLAIVLVAVVLAFTLVGCNAANTVGKNIVAGGEQDEAGNSKLVFESSSAMKEIWDTTGTASGAAVTAASNGIKLNTSSGGYAMATQKVKLRANSYYKVSYTYETSSMSAYNDGKTTTYEGLFVTFLEDEDFIINDEAAGDGSDVKYQSERYAKTEGNGEYYFKVGNMHQATLAICLGTEEKPVNCSSAIVKTIKLERVDGVPEGTTALALVSNEYGEAMDYNVVYVVLGAVATIIIGYAIYMARARVKAKEELGETGLIQKTFKSNKYVGIAATVGIALIIRLLILAIQSGIQGATSVVYYGYDASTSATLGAWLGKNGTPYFFEYNTSAAFMPFALYLMALVGAMTNGAANAVLAYTAVMKMFAVLADIGTALFIYFIINKKRGSLTAALYAALYSLLPAVFSMSAAWGTMESIAVFFVVLTYYFILDKKYIASCGAYFVATMTASISLMVVPFVLLYSGLLIYKGAKEKDYWSLVKVVSCMAGGIVLFYLISLPFAINQIKAGTSDFAFTQYIATIKGLNVYSANAFNFQGMIGNNFKTVTTESTFITIVFVLFIVAVLAVPYFKTRSRLNLVGISAAGALIYWIFCNNLSQDGLLLVLPLLLIYAGLVEDKRVYAMTVLLGALAFINSSYFYLVAGTETVLAQIDNPVINVIGAFMMVYIIAFVIIVYDVMISKKCKEQLSLKVPYTEYAASVAKNAVISSKNAYYKSVNFLKSAAQATKETIADWKARKSNNNSENEEDK